MKNTEEIRRDYVENSQKAKYNTLLARCTSADQEAIKALAIIDDNSGGQIDRLVAIYKTIKFNNK